MKISQPSPVVAGAEPATEYVNAVAVAEAHRIAATSGDNQSNEAARQLVRVGQAFYGQDATFAQRVADSIGHEAFAVAGILSAAQNWARSERGEPMIPILPDNLIMKVNGSPVDWPGVFAAFATIREVFAPEGCTVEIVEAP